MAKTSIKNNAGLDADDIPEAQIVGKDSPMEEAPEYVGQVKVINNITGEVMERDYSSVHDIKTIMVELNASKLAIDRAIKKLKFKLEEFMTSYDEYEFADGDRAYWVAPQKHEISYTVVAEALGQDVAALFSQISITKLKDYLEECIEHGDMTRDEAADLLSKSTVTPSKAFIKIGSTKR